MFTCKCLCRTDFKLYFWEWSSFCCTLKEIKERCKDFHHGIINELMFNDHDNNFRVISQIIELQMLKGIDLMWIGHGIYLGKIIAHPGIKFRHCSTCHNWQYFSTFVFTLLVWSLFWFCIFFYGHYVLNAGLYWSCVQERGMGL